MTLSNKKWVIAFVVTVLLLLSGAGAITIVIDPYFHYHKPLSDFQYVIENQRYQNNGIVKHFDYDAIITGTSMAENFKKTQMDTLFGVNAVKVPFSGSTYREINDNLKVALKHNPDIRIILRCMDYEDILRPADAMNYDEEMYPEYMYDDCSLNDAGYIFNKEILFGETYSVIEYTRDGGVTTDFDVYGNWMEGRRFGKDALDSVYTRPEREVEAVFSEEDREMVEENITKNVTDLAKRYPKTEFYLFFAPYSIYFWDQLQREGQLQRQLDAEKCAIELLLREDNIHLFSFYTEYGMICNLDNYKDIKHYSEDINSQILLWMKEGTHELTEENYKEYCSQVRAFYESFDYERLFE